MVLDALSPLMTEGGKGGAVAGWVCGKRRGGRDEGGGHMIGEGEDEERRCGGMGQRRLQQQGKQGRGGVAGWVGKRHAVAGRWDGKE